MISGLKIQPSIQTKVIKQFEGAFFLKNAALIRIEGIHIFYKISLRNTFDYNDIKWKQKAISIKILCSKKLGSLQTHFKYQASKWSKKFRTCINIYIYAHVSPHIFKHFFI